MACVCLGINHRKSLRLYDKTIRTPKIQACPGYFTTQINLSSSPFFLHLPPTIRSSGCVNNLFSFIKVNLNDPIFPFLHLPVIRSSRGVNNHKVSSLLKLTLKHSIYRFVCISILLIQYGHMYVCTCRRHSRRSPLIHAHTRIHTSN